jgi:hypothetical protein
MSFCTLIHVFFLVSHISLYFHFSLYISLHIILSSCVFHFAFYSLIDFLYTGSLLSSLFFLPFSLGG